MTLEEQLQQLHLQAEQHFQEREELVRIHMEHQHAIQTLTMEKEELVRTHTLESGELRKKVSILTEKLEAATWAQLTELVGQGEAYGRSIFEYRRRKRY